MQLPVWDKSDITKTQIKCAVMRQETQCGLHGPDGGVNVVTVGHRWMSVIGCMGFNLKWDEAAV